MITFTCPTCESTLVAKDEKLIGQILACPKCGGMVLVQQPDDAPTPEYREPPKSVVHKRFPDVLSHETPSGVIGPTPKEQIRSDLLLVEDLPETDVSATEIKTRKVLVGILLGLLILLIAAFGFLMLFRKEVPVQAPPKAVIPVPAAQPQPPAAPPLAIPEAPPNEVQPQEPPIDEKPTESSPPEPVSQETSAEQSAFAELPASSELSPLPAEEQPPEDDSLAAFERHMPGLLETSIPNIDIEAKLALPILELKIEQQPLIDFVRFLSNLTAIPITLDIDEMKSIALSVQTPVSGHFTETTAGTVLTETLTSVGLQWKAADRQITILPPNTADDHELTFDVSDFSERTDDLTPDVLVDMIKKLVCPEENISIIRDQRLSVVRDENSVTPLAKSRKRLETDILRLLEQLRVIRQLPLQTELKEETLAPEAFGWDQVMEPMTLHYYRPTPLTRVKAQLESHTPLTILVDHQSLHQALCWFAGIQTTVQCNAGTVNDVLELSLAAVDSAALAYRIVDHQTLEITTAESVQHPKKMTVEVHRYHLEEGETPEEIVQSLRSAIVPESWFVASQPETQYGGNIVIDRPSGCFFVRQSQPVQRQIRLYLSETALQ